MNKYVINPQSTILDTVRSDDDLDLRYLKLTGGTLTGALGINLSNLTVNIAPAVSGYAGIVMDKPSTDITTDFGLTWKIDAAEKWTMGMDVANADLALVYDWSINGDVVRLSPGGKIVFGPGIGSPASYTYQMTVAHDADQAATTIDGITILNGTTGIRLDLLQSRHATAFGTADYTGGAIGMRTNQHLIFGTNDLERMRIDNTGKVGIGTSPSVAFHVLNTAEQLRIAYDASNYCSIQSRNNGDISIINTGTSNGIYFAAYSASNSTKISSLGSLVVNSTADSSFTGTGKVGIGTASPADILHIKKSSGVVILDTAGAGGQINLNFADNGSNKWAFYKTTGNDLRIYDYQGTAGDRVTFQASTGNVGIGTTNPGALLSFGNNLNRNLNFYEDGSNGLSFEVRGGMYELTSRGSVPISFATKPYASAYATAPTYLMTLLTNGNVGIGTTGPGSPLEVVGQTRLTSGNATGALRIGADVNATTLTNNVRKIGRITIPTYASATTNSFVLAGDNDNGINGVYIGGYPGASIYAATDIHFLTAANATTTGGTERLTILSSGKVGVNDTGPSSQLDVTGDINSTDVYKVDDVQVLSNRVIDARIDDTPNSGDATTDGIIAAIQSILQTHGLAAAA